MAFVNADRVAETSTTTGTGTYSLAGVATGFGAVRTFVAGVGGGNKCHYCAYDDDNWEVGIGTVTDAAPDTLSRETIIASSNGGAAVNWGAGTRTIICTGPASRVTGLTEVANEQPTTDVANITVTGLSEHKFVKILGSLYPTASGATLSLRARISAGTWRTIGTIASNPGGQRRMHFEVNIANFNVAQEKPIDGHSIQSTSALDSSDNANLDFGVGDVIGAFASWDEVWDEIELSFSTGNIEGSAADQRGRVLVYGG